MTSKDKRLFPPKIYLIMEKYTTLSYSPLFFFYFMLSNIVSNFLMTELPTANFISNNPNPFTDGQTGSQSLYSSFIRSFVRAYYILCLVMISVQYFRLYQHNHNLVSCQINCIQAASINVIYSGMYK